MPRPKRKSPSSKPDLDASMVFGEALTTLGFWYDKKYPYCHPFSDAWSAVDDAKRDRDAFEAVEFAWSAVEDCAPEEWWDAADRASVAKEFRRAVKTFENAFATWLEPYINEGIGRRKRGQSKGNDNRRGKTKKFIDEEGNERRASVQELRLEVLRMHDEDKDLTFPKVREKVRKKFRYESDRPVYDACRKAPRIRW
jgi:hypothetical protein